MEKQDKIRFLAETEDDRILLARVYDKITAGERKGIPAFSAFLTPREQIMVRSLMDFLPICFLGGREGAERAVCCYLPEYLTEQDLLDDEFSPVCAVRATFYAEDSLTHRDILGALMGMGIKRETVGDIYVSDGFCDFFVTREILPYVLSQMESAGRTHLRLQNIPLSQVIVPIEQTREIKTTVSSLRLDSVLGAGFGLPRAKAVQAVEAGRVFLNDKCIFKADKPVAQGDKITLRGQGKILLQTVGGKTRKERLSITICRFG